MRVGLMGERRETGLARMRRRIAWWGSPQGVRVLLILVMLFAFALRLYRLGYQSIWYDEGVSIHLATKDLGGLTRHTAGDIHPPLYYYLLHFWILAAGSSEFSAAFLSLIFGVLIIPLAYLLGRRLHDQRIALLSAVSPFNLWYSQEIRMYTLGAFLGLISLYCLTRLLHMRAAADPEAEASPDPAKAGLIVWVCYVLSAAAGLYTLYYFAFLLLFENLFVLGWWAFSRFRKAAGPLSLARWAAAQAVVLLLYLPWLPIALRQALDPPVPPWRGFTALGEVLLDSWAALSVGQSVDPQSVLIWPLLSFLFAVYLLGLLSPRVGARPGAGAVLLCGYSFAPLVVIYLLSLRTPLFHVRYMFTYSPPFYLVLALGFARLKKVYRVALPLGLTILALAYGYAIYNFHFVPEYASDDHRGAVAYVDERFAPGDAVLINAGYAYPPFLYYYQGDVAWRGRLVDYEPASATRQGAVLLQTGVTGGDEGLGWGDPASDFYATTEDETARALEQVFAHHPRVWVYRIYDTVTDPQGFIRDWLEGHGRQIGDSPFPGESYMRVQCYETKPKPPYRADITHHPLDVVLEERVSLVGFDAPGGVRSGRALPLTLYWQARARLGADYHLVLRLQAGDGEEFARLDQPLSPPTTEWQVGKVISQSLSLGVPAGTPPLSYDLMIEVYDPVTGQSLTPPQDGGSMGSVVVARPLVPRRPPRMTHEPWANFGNLLQLAGYEMEPAEVQAGDRIDLELLWRAWDAPLPLIQMVVTLRGKEGRPQPIEWSSYLGGEYRSSRWETEELVRGIHRLKIPHDLAPGSYDLTVTLRRASATGEVAEAEGGDIIPLLPESGVPQDSFTLGTVQVAGP